MSRADRALDPEVAAHRDPDHEVAPLFVERWSPRAMSGEPVDESAYRALFEAARWAPSSYNSQGWRFLYAPRDGDHWDTYLDLLYEQNRAWAKDAAVLVAVASRTVREGREGTEPAATHSFDAGAAWQNLALEGARRDLVVHAMEGYDEEAAREALAVPEEFELEAMIAIGERGDTESLPEPLQEREVPSGRKPVDEIAVRGRFSED
jgi:nitroreductase